MTFYSVPAYLKPEQGKIANFGLLFQRYYPYDDLPNDKDIPHKESAQKLCKMYQPHGATKIIAQRNDTQYACLESMAKNNNGNSILELSAALTSRFITGIGEPTPGEVGMAFDRNSGAPYIPAASVKGAVRNAYAVNYARKNPSEVGVSGTIEEEQVPGLTELFGALDTKEASRGGYVFMDTYSSEAPPVVEDIMNPHFSKYYQGEGPPSEIENPNPIKFLAVEKNCTFYFRGFFVDPECIPYRADLIEAYTVALTEFGLGAKTSSGYGRFTIPIDSTIKIKENALQKAQEKQDEIDRKKKEQDERDKLAQAKKEREIQEAEDKRKNEEYETALKNSSGIDKDILLLRNKGSEELAIQVFDRWLKDTQNADGKQLELARLIMPFFRTYGKKTKASKLKRHNHCKKLVSD